MMLDRKIPQVLVKIIDFHIFCVRCTSIWTWSWRLVCHYGWWSRRRHVQYVYSCSNARIETSEIDEVILVGGMSSIRHILETVESIFSHEACRGVNTDEVATISASNRDGVWAGKLTDILLFDITPLFVWFTRYIFLSLHLNYYVQVLKFPNASLLNPWAVTPLFLWRGLKSWPLLAVVT